MLAAILTAIIVFGLAIVALIAAGRADEQDEFWQGGEWSDRKDDQDNSK